MTPICPVGNLTRKQLRSYKSQYEDLLFPAEDIRAKLALMSASQIERELSEEQLDEAEGTLDLVLDGTMPLRSGISRAIRYKVKGTWNLLKAMYRDGELDL